MSLTRLDATPAWARTHRLRLVLLWLLCVGASLTILTHVAQLLGITFQVYALCAAAVSLAVTAIAYFILRRQFEAASRLEGQSALLLFCLGLAGAAVALILNLPSGDDYYYVPNTIYYLQHPAARMGFDIHFLYSGQEPFRSVFWATSGPYEYLQGATVHLLRLDFLTVYYGVATAAVGFLLPVVVFLLLARFTNRTIDAAIGAAAALGIILLLGERTHSYGNIALARAFEGKGALLAVGLPAFLLCSLEYLESPTGLALMGVMASAIATMGMSSSAVFLLPALATALATANVVTTRYRGDTIRSLPMYFIALSYLALYALYIRRFGSASELGFESPANLGWPRSFSGHLGMLINPAQPFTAIAAAVSTGLALWLLPAHHRRFLACWIAALVALYLNPIAGDFLIRHVTSPNAYWRMFYLLPFPLTAGLAASACAYRIRPWRFWRRLTALGVACVMLAGAHLVLPVASIFRGQYVTAGIPGYKILPAILQQAREVIAIAPKGPMLAPRDIAGMLAMLDSDYPQLRIREDAERVWMSSQGRVSEAELRIHASQYLDDDPAGDYLSLEKLLAKRGAIRSIVLSTGVWQRPEVGTLLARYGYDFRSETGDYVVVWK